MTGKTIFKWVVGIIFLLAGVTGAINKEYSAIFMILLGLFIIPESYKLLIDEKANLKLTSKTKWIVTIALLVTIGVADAMNSGRNLTDLGSTKNEGRDAKIESTNYYLENRYEDVTDENGIAYDLNVETIEVSRTKMYESGKINMEKGGFIIVSSYKIVYDFRLLSNGELKDVIKYEGYLLDSKRSDDNGAMVFCSDNYTYFPELESEKKNKIISDFTGGNCGMGAEINNLVKRERIAAVKACGIIDAE